MMMKRLNLALRFLVAAAIGLTVIVIQAPPADAQERRSFFQRIFGIRPRYQQPRYEQAPVYEPRRQRQKQRPKAAKTRQKATSAKAAAKPAPVVVKKQEDAKKVLVIGDFIADSLGDGLEVAFETTPGIIIDARSNGSSGLVRADFFDWPSKLQAFIAEVKPAVVIVSLGANDRQQMTVAGQKEKFRSEAWLAEYRQRTAALAALARKDNLPLLWVGMPSFQSTSMAADMVTLNGIYRTEVEKAGGTFIDIWDGFVDENGKFITTGSDINGQQVRLRGSDGINLTKAGKRKLAFYVEKDIRKLLGDAALSGRDVPGAAGLKDLVVTAPAANEDILKTLPISLDDPELDGGTTLMGAATAAAGSGKSPRELLVEKGEVVKPPRGRIDDFRLAKPQTVISNPVIRN